MSHLDEGTILAIRDGALVSTDAEVHAEGCDVCWTALEEARRRSAQIERMLATLDAPIDVEAAKARVRAQMDAERATGSRGVSGHRHLGRAAAILLVAAGAAYALPGSPVRSWLGLESSETVEVAPDRTVGPRGFSSGIDVPVADGRIAIVIRDAEVGALIEVVWSDEAVARLSSGPGSSYSASEGRLEATVPEGPIRVEIPSGTDVEAVSLEVNGRMLIQRTSGGWVLESVVEEGSERTVLAVPER